MKKQLIIKGKIVEMTFEEVLEKFTPAIHREINKQKAKVDRQEEEREDMFQDASIWLYKAYEKYDIDKGFYFFTMAKEYIRRGVQEMDYLNRRQKRSAFTISLDEQLSGTDEEFTLQNLLSEDVDMSAPMEAKEILQIAVQSMTNTEAEYLVYMLEDYNPSEVAEEKGVTRQGTSTIYRQIRKKIKLAAQEYNCEE